MTITTDSSRLTSNLLSFSAATAVSVTFGLSKVDNWGFSSVDCITEIFSGTVELAGGIWSIIADSGLSLFPEEVVSEITVLLSTRCRADLFRKLHPRLSLEPLFWNAAQITSYLTHRQRKLWLPSSYNSVQVWYWFPHLYYDLSTLQLLTPALLGKWLQETLEEQNLIQFVGKEKEKKKNIFSKGYIIVELPLHNAQDLQMYLANNK